MLEKCQTCIAYLLLYLLICFDKLRGISTLSFSQLTGIVEKSITPEEPRPDNYIQSFPFDFIVEGRTCFISRVAFYQDQKVRLCFGPINKKQEGISDVNFTMAFLERGFFFHNFHRMPWSFLKGLLRVVSKTIMAKSDHSLESAIVICAFWKAYGHFIHDTLPIIHYALQHTDKSFSKYNKAPIIIAADPIYHAKVIEAVGIDPSRVRFLRSGEVLRVESALFASIGHRSSEKIEFAINHFKQNILTPNIKTHARIFIDRKWTDSRVVQGRQRERLFKLFYEYNVTPLAFEDYSFEEQISFIRSARLIIGYHGSGVANLHFSIDPTTLLLLYESAEVRKNQSMFDDILPSHVEKHEIICPSDNLDFDSIEKKLKALTENREKHSDLGEAKLL